MKLSNLNLTDLNSLDHSMVFTSLGALNLINNSRRLQGKKELSHKNLIRKIREFESVDTGLNFELSTYTDESGKQSTMYNITLIGLRMLIASESKIVMAQLMNYLGSVEKEYQVLIKEREETNRKLLDLESRLVWEYRNGKRKPYNQSVRVRG
ncbi:hypothetical protein [Photobacterium leiognathi]|uniref:hypothetical protein n=1 Tax=Photobacterium leiognathi TaxID=553611 RepID=UPI0029815A95|nr:hypothetical protein [Photobacterium leiognathi]